MFAVFFLLAMLFAGAWYVMSHYVPYENIQRLYVLLALKGICGALLAIAVCLILSMVICFNPWMAPPEGPGNLGLVSWDDSRKYMCGAVAIGVCMIGIPVGFLLGVAKANKARQNPEVSTAVKIPFPEMPKGAFRPSESKSDDVKGYGSEVATGDFSSIYRQAVRGGDDNGE